MDEKERYNEFLRKIQNKGSNKHSMGHCLGTRDAWKWVRKNKWKALGGTPIDELLYSRIINAVNKVLIEKLLEGHEIEFPHLMGKLLLSSMPTWVSWEDGVVRTNYKNDWKKTMELWYQDEEALKARKRVKRVGKDIYFIRYYKTGAKYHNRGYYMFNANRSLRKTLGKKVEAEKVHAEQLEF